MAASEEYRTGKGGYSGRRVHHNSTGKVYYSPLQKQSVGMPCHVGERTIDYHEEENHEEHIAREAHALSERAGDERRGDNGKLHLEQCVERERNGCTAEDVASRSGVDIRAHIVEHQERERVAYDAADIVAETEAETEHHPQHTDYSHRYEALQHGGYDVLRAHHTAVEERQSRCHHEHEDCRRDEPSHVGGVDFIEIALERRFFGKQSGNGYYYHCRH